MAELESITSKKMAGDIKSFLSQETDVFRVPYGKVTEAFPRRGIIVGSTNSCLLYTSPSPRDRG